MKFAVTILLALAAVGLLVRAYFSPVRPFNVIMEAVRLLPRFLRKKWGLWLAVAVIMALSPLGPLLGASIGDNPFGRVAFGLLWQGMVTAGLALVAIRIHRGLILREGVNTIELGRREFRMVGYVMAVWFAVLVVRSAPTLVPLISPNIIRQGIGFLLTLGSWLMIVALALVGPSASLDEAAPVRTSWLAFKKDFFGVAGIVLLSQGAQALAGMSLASGVYLAGGSGLVSAAAALAALCFLVVTFFAAELALVIGLTRIFENRFDDTRSREHNAGWH